ncbi:MAG: ATP-dependent helicase [Deltaproteobacteria bacterium]|nr:ATP-dependent helicase [Deltaproteobacteria bacterium]
MVSNSQSGIWDNYRRGNVGDFLRSKIQKDSFLSIVSAYFTIYAYDTLSAKLDGINRLRFLFGEPSFIKSLDPNKSDNKSFRIENDQLELTNQLQQKYIAAECAKWIQNKVDIKSVKQSNLLHGKMYHIAHNEVEDAIIGSSNFTVRGLGLAANGNNIELNLEVDSSRDRRDLKAWFDEIWNDAALVEDVKQEVLQYLEQLFRNQSPEFVYYKTLYHVFEQYLRDQSKADLLLGEKSQIVDTDIWKALFAFQKDGVKGAINKILQHNGCIIADSVGLGKTYEGLAIIKYFELRNDKVLVLCPKKLRENWTVYQAQNNSELNPFVNDRFGYTVLCHTDLSRDGGLSGDINLSTINWGNYNLVVIDESHNFRNNTKGKLDEDGNIIRQTRYERLMEKIIKDGVKTKVLLISATPVNNTLKDLRNQLYFLTGEEKGAFKDSIGIANLDDTIAAAQRAFTDWTKQDKNHRTSNLLEKLNSSFFKLLDELTIARSRKHIQTYYADSIKELGGFPERLKPISLVAEIDIKGRFMSYDRLNDEISKYKLSLFNPSMYVLPEYQAKYDQEIVKNFRQSDRENFLIGMMKVNFLKRLESSIFSFAITLERTLEKIEELKNRIERFKKFKAENPDLDFDDLSIDTAGDEELQAALEVGKKLTYKMAHLRLDDWLKDLNDDLQNLQVLAASAKDVNAARDAKLHQLKDLLEKKVKNPSTDKVGNPNHKVLVFTAFADTAVYLYDNIKDWAVKELNINVALVTGGSAENKTTFGKNNYIDILINFSPIAKNRAKMPSMPQDGQIDLLIATDCISEGQNLQDCDYLINYDIHWNPVRIIQRFGRIDRIGSINAKVQLVNFWPTNDLNKYINLKNRVEAKMALVDIAATQGDNPLTQDIEDLIKDDLKYRDKQLMRLQNEVLDMEDFNESVTLNEFTLDDFRIDLLNYIESNRKLLEDAPLGLYSVAPVNPEYPMISPGVIFCLRQKTNSRSSETINPLQPYFLVYVHDDKNVRYTFAQPKQILEIYRVLSAGKTTPYAQLCDLFDVETCNGSDMTKYSELLKSAVDSIIRTFQKRAISHLQSGRGAVLMEQQDQVKETDDFELITWLVIKNE